MPIELRRSYLNEIRLRYRNSTKKEKSGILNEFCLVAKYSRKYAVRVLRCQAQPKLKKPGPKTKYTAEVIVHLEAIWEATGRICSKSLKQALAHWLEHYKGNITANEKALLLQMSASTIDRQLKPYREKRPKAKSTTCPSKIKNKIPLKLLDGEINYPGFVEVDTVAHCGESLSGEFISTLTLTDLFSGWTENRALWNKPASEVLKQLMRIEGRLPFCLTGVASDNGSEFINHEVHNYLVNRNIPLNFVRRRAYKKNDNAHVEQKNFTHVRELIGYDRLDEEWMVGLINEIYQAYFNPLRNFFIPSMKLIEKTRVGSKIIKKYDTPKTPYQRLMESPHVPRLQKKKLKEQYENKSPFFLREQLDKKLKELFDYVERKKNLKFRATGSDS